MGDRDDVRVGPSCLLHSDGVDWNKSSCGQIKEVEEVDEEHCDITGPRDHRTVPTQAETLSVSFK